VGKSSKIKQLPDQVREQLDAQLVKRGFTGYPDLEAWLKGLGISIGKSSIHRYGAALERRLAAIRASTDAAKLIAQEMPDEAGNREAAVMSMISADVFEIVVQMQEVTDPEVNPLKRAEVMSKLAKNWATMTRASIALKRHQETVTAKARAAADAAERVAVKGGASKETVDELRRQILGIAD
jgi:hypothetical protein